MHRFCTGFRLCQKHIAPSLYWNCTRFWHFFFFIGMCWFCTGVRLGKHQAFEIYWKYIKSGRRFNGLFVFWVCRFNTGFCPTCLKATQFGFAVKIKHLRCARIVPNLNLGVFLGGLGLGCRFCLAHDTRNCCDGILFSSPIDRTSNGSSLAVPLNKPAILLVLLSVCHSVYFWPPPAIHKHQKLKKLESTQS